MGSTQSTTKSSTTLDNVRLQLIRANIHELRETFGYVVVVYQAVADTTFNTFQMFQTSQTSQTCILEKTTTYNEALSCLQQRHVTGNPVDMYVHPETQQIYRIMDNAIAIDIIHVDALDAQGNLYVNQRGTQNGDLIET